MNILKSIRKKNELPVESDASENNLHVDSEALKQTEALKQENAMLKGIQSAMPDPYYVRDMDYNIILWPDSIAKLMGFSSEEAKKLKCYDIFRADVCPPKAECPTQRCIEVRQFLKDVAVDVYHKNGSTVHSLVSNAGVYDEDGNPTAAVEIVKDNTTVKESMDSIGAIIKKIESVSSVLTSEIEDVKKSSEQVNEKAHESLDGIKTGVQAGNSVNEKAGNSSNHAASVRTNMHKINESMKFSIEKISSLKTKTEAISLLVTMIQDIASQTNLLAINASIQAAHAGEAGRGFKVVADGIRELSKSSNESALSIKGTIQEIAKLVEETTTSLDITEHDFEAGVKDISELLTFINDIDSAADTLLHILGNIENGVVITSELGEKQNVSVVEVSKVGNELTEIAHKLSLEFDIVFNATQHVDMG